MSDAVLAGVLVAVAVAVTSVFWILFGATRFYDLRREHAAEIEAVHAGYEIQRRTYGAVPVEDLLKIKPDGSV